MLNNISMQMTDNYNKLGLVKSQIEGRIAQNGTSNLMKLQLSQDQVAPIG